VLLDEPSMGLAPIIVEEIFGIIRQLNKDERVSFLLAEQNANLVLRFADHAYVLENGRVAASGSAAELAARDDVKQFYLGAAPANAAAA
jgi:branched-chain amino acid transport system ATP-binding protein